MRHWRKLLGIISTTAIVVLMVTALVKAQSIEDWFRLRNYSPPPVITKIASDDRLSPRGQHILYVTHPQLTTPTDFVHYCPQTEQTIVLGCYHSGVTAFTGDSFLFVKAVSDKRLSGVEEVTTAHEMLHAAYDRLSSKQRDNVNAMLMDYYNNGLKDQRIIDTINSYKKTEPNDVVNEMHSVFGTEVANLPAPLENYYKQYFSDRSAVVDFAQNYEGEFTKRKALLNAYSEEMKQLKADIQLRETNLQGQYSYIQSQRPVVEKSNDPALIAAYNSKVTGYNNSLLSLRSEIAKYNQLVNNYNQVAMELSSLQNSLTSQLAPQ